MSFGVNGCFSFCDISSSLGGTLADDSGPMRKIVGGFCALSTAAGSLIRGSIRAPWHSFPGGRCPDPSGETLASVEGSSAAITLCSISPQAHPSPAFPEAGFFGTCKAKETLSGTPDVAPAPGGEGEGRMLGATNDENEDLEETYPN